MLSGSNAFEFAGPSGQEGDESWPGSSSDGVAGFGTSTSAAWPELSDTSFPMTGLHNSSNISASWPSAHQVCLGLDIAVLFQAPVGSGICVAAGKLCCQ